LGSPGAHACSRDPHAPAPHGADLARIVLCP